MDQYVTGAVIRRFREERKMTQAALAERLHVSDKAVSKWETGRGYPDITLVEPIAEALGISVLELLSGNGVTNRNRSFNMRRTRMYVCPICGNVLWAAGEAVIACCGLTLVPLEAEEPDREHLPQAEIVEDEYFIRVPHDMTKTHYISFFAAFTDEGARIAKLYPEGNAEARFPVRMTREIYFYCNRHGYYRARIADILKPAQ